MDSEIDIKYKSIVDITPYIYITCQGSSRSGISIKGWRAWSYCCHVSLTLWQTSTALRPGKWGSDCPQHVGGENTDCYIGLDPHPSCPLLHNVRVPPCWTAHCQGQEPTSANGHFRRQIPFYTFIQLPTFYRLLNIIFVWS